MLFVFLKTTSVFASQVSVNVCATHMLAERESERETAGLPVTNDQDDRRGPVSALFLRLKAASVFVTYVSAGGCPE